MDESKLEKQIALLQAKIDKANKKLDAIEAKIEAIRTASQKADNSTDNSWREPEQNNGF